MLTSWPPRTRPRRTEPDIAQRIIELRHAEGWGARKIRAVLEARGVSAPSIRAVHAVLDRAGLVVERPREPAPVRFEWSASNQLWQADFKSFAEAGRARVHQFTVLDDHSRFLLALRHVDDLALNRAWTVLWDVFGECGLPDALLTDNAFSSRCPQRTLSWFDARLIRLGIRPTHGRPFHPQTQGKIERLHGTLERECFPRVRRDTLARFVADCAQWRTRYNTQRPHEALGDVPPCTRWTPSPRPRPPRLPEVHYPPGTITRKVASGGDIHYKRLRILAGHGLVGQHVAIEEHDHELVVRYADHVFGRIPAANAVPGTTVR